MDDLGELNGVVLEDTLLLSSSSSPSLSPDPFSVGPEPWAVAERATGEIIGQVQATITSDDRRNKVIDYVQRLLRNCIGCEVFPYGSVPLKTYLPDGDIDLTIFSGSNLDETLAKTVCSVLEAEDQNPSAECIVKDVQYIRAEVKLVKCLVQNIVVDISINQLGGLCTLCFLEKVDRLIGKDHLFKRSIILIKAWCYYESRILGAHHGLISTYALETLVLYIFHLFHSSLNGPLAVLYKFLDYFSKFDWESFCVSLSGPIPLSSLPEFAVERPGITGSHLLLSDEFLKDCVEKFSVPIRAMDTSSRIFTQKHLNIVDPLRENNNLGRSVSKGNFFRIRSAFSYGARKLGQILLKPEENVAEEVSKFFANTLDRHGKGLRPDVPETLPVSLSSLNTVLEMPPFSDHEPFREKIQSCEPEFHLDCDTTPYVQQIGTNRSPVSESERGDTDSLTNSRHFSSEIDNDLSSSVISLELANGLHGSSLSRANVSKCSLSYVPHDPHLYYPDALENGKMENGYGDDKKKSIHCPASVNGEVSCEQEQAHLHNSHEPLNSQHLEHCSLPQAMNPGTSYEIPDRSSSSSGSGCSNRMPMGSSLRGETEKPLSDLCGDLDNHLDSLLCARWWFDHAVNGTTPFVPSLHPPIPWLQGKIQWESLHIPLQYSRYMLAQINPNNSVMTRPPYSPMNPAIMHAAAFGVEEVPRTRGTGTYFPITNSQSYRDRSSQTKGRGLGPPKSPRSSNGRVAPFSDRNPPVKNNRDNTPHNTQQPSSSFSPKGKVFNDSANGFMEAAENGVEGGGACGNSSPQSSRTSPSVESMKAPNFSSDLATEVIPMGNDNRVKKQSYRLKDEDFPPLSSS